MYFLILDYIIIIINDINTLSTISITSLKTDTKNNGQY